MSTTNGKQRNRRLSITARLAGKDHVLARQLSEQAEADATLADAPLELKKATEALNRANALQEKGEPQVEIGSTAHGATQQARTALAVAATKANDLAIAGAADTALVGMGLAAQRATTVGHGEDHPIADNGSETNRALNRRVEVTIAEGDQPVGPRR